MRYLDRGHLGLRETWQKGNSQEIHKDDPPTKTPSKSGECLAFSYNHLGGYPNGHHKSLHVVSDGSISAEIHSQALGQVLEVQLKRRRDCMSKEGKDYHWKPTETTDLR